MKKVFTWVLLMLSSTAFLLANGQQENVETSTSSSKWHEAPILHELVVAGKLPSLEDRMPVASDIMVEPDVLEIGEYGGSLAMTSHDHAHWTWGPITEQAMFRFKQDGSGEVEANVAKAYYANEDSTVWTIELREGMRWSDGEPFTADDIIFYYNHMSTPALNDDRTPVSVEEKGYHNAFTSKPYRAYHVSVYGMTYWAKFDKVDDYKITVTFAAPKADFPESVAIDNKWMFAPKHFFKDLVSRKDGVTNDPSFPLITEEQAIANANRIFDKEWASYSKMGKSTGYYNWDYYQVPQLRSFIATKNNWNKVGEFYELVRNPYFFKTDSEGNQLPYLDSIKIEIINEKEQIVLKSTAGEYDMISVKSAGNNDSRVSNKDFSVVATATKDSHNIVKWITNNWGTADAIQLNQTVKDEYKRELFQDKRFREALSICVDRNLLNATLANGQSAPSQMSVPEGMIGYDKKWSQKWTEYDVAKANALLDEITETWAGTEGTYRSMKGINQEVEIIVLLEKPSTEGSLYSLLKSAYAKVGVKLSEKLEADIPKAILANDIEAQLKSLTCITPALRSDDVVPMRNYQTWYGAYGKWFEDGKSTANGGVAPSGDMLDLINAYEKIRAAAGPSRNQTISENVQKIYDLHKENVWVIGYLKAAPTRYIISNELKNFKEQLIDSDEYRYENIVRPEQLYKVK
jgi:peptide/nickel transport system substrate-binding protein